MICRTSWLKFHASVNLNAIGLSVFELMSLYILHNKICSIYITSLVYIRIKEIELPYDSLHGTISTIVLSCLRTYLVFRSV